MEWSFKLLAEIANKDFCLYFNIATRSILDWLVTELELVIKGPN